VCVRVPSFCVVSQHPNHYTTRPLLLCSLINCLVIRRCLRNLDKKNGPLQRHWRGWCDRGCCRQVSGSTRRTSATYGLSPPMGREDKGWWRLSVPVSDPPATLPARTRFLLQPRGRAKYCYQQVCLSVCLLVYYTSKLLKSSVHVTCGSGLVVLWGQCNIFALPVFQFCEYHYVCI